MKSINQYFIEERFRMMPMPHWYQWFKWIIYFWRRINYRLSQRNKITFPKCIVCNTTISDKLNNCPICNINKDAWIIKQTSSLDFNHFLLKVKQMNPPKQTILLDKKIGRKIQLISIDFDKKYQVDLITLLNKLNNRLIIRFSKFTTITKKDIIDFQNR